VKFFLIVFFSAILIFGLPSWLLQKKIAERLEELGIASVKDLINDYRNDNKSSQFDLLTAANIVNQIGDERLTNLVRRLKYFRMCHFAMLALALVGEYFWD